MYGAGLLDTDGDGGEVVILNEEPTALKGGNRVRAGGGGAIGGMCGHW